MAAKQRPHITLKLATSLDARIATRTGESQWITSPEARNEVHKLRAEHQGILVGVGTVLADNPSLTARTEPVPDRQPLRIVLDSQLRTPLSSTLVKNDPETTLIICANNADDTKTSALQRKGVSVKPVSASNGHLDLLETLNIVRDFGIASVFIEGGGQVAASFLRANLVDRLEWFRAPMLIGSDGIPAFGGLDVAALTDALSMRRLDVSEVGPDLWERYERA